MDFKRLQTFVTVAEQGSVSKASGRLHITQPALSRQLKALQEELNLELFERVGRRLVLTGEGEQFLKQCRDLLNHANSLAEHARSLRKGSAGVLKVAASPQVIENVFATFLPRYAERHPDVRIQPIEVLAAEQAAQLASGEIHMAVNMMEMMSFRVLAVSDRSVGVGERGVVDIRKLSGLPLLVVNSGFGTRQMFDAACRLSRLQVDIFMESGAPHTLLALAEAGRGVAIIPSTVLIRNRALRIASVCYRGQPLGGTLAILWDKRRSLPRYAEGFAEALKAHVKRIFPKY
jgi:DNA-binding transcriptional LysR family regulator